MIPSEMPLLPRGDTNGHGAFPGHGAEHGGHGGFGGSVAGMFGQFGPDQMQMLQSLQQIAGQQKVKQEVRLLSCKRIRESFHNLLNLGSMSTKLKCESASWSFQQREGTRWGLF